MPGLNYKFLEKPKQQLLCPLCRKPLCDPVQVSTCGHHLCNTCLLEFLSEGLPILYHQETLMKYQYSFN
uniref:Zinc finger C3HC4 RING-type domain-containing protein n=1 Tax=Spermophilus dauricus TaxID=99837 RepID=A0A8C9US31_SPEDA